MACCSRCCYLTPRSKFRLLGLPVLGSFPRAVFCSLPRCLVPAVHHKDFCAGPCSPSLLRPSLRRHRLGRECPKGVLEKPAVVWMGHHHPYVAHFHFDAVTCEHFERLRQISHRLVRYHRTNPRSLPSRSPYRIERFPAAYEMIVLVDVHTSKRNNLSHLYCNNFQK